MLTSNVQLGYVLKKGGEGGGSKLSRAVYLTPPPPRISARIYNTLILLHLLLQEYLDERDVNFISVSLRCFLQTFSWVLY